MINPMDLSGKHILVTGASAGIGKATAILISKLGGRVSLVARNEEKLNETLSCLIGGGHAIYPYDVRDIDGIEALLKSVITVQGAFSGLVHCAGIADMRPLSMTKYDFLHNMMLTNFYSFIEMCRIYAKKNFNNGGSIVAMSSACSQKGDKSKTAYCSSKAAIDGAIRAIAPEMAVKNIRINSILSGFIKTDLYYSYISTAGEEAMISNVLDKQYLGMGEVIDVANAICYLLSDTAKFITGTGFVVDGGYLS